MRIKLTLRGRGPTDVDLVVTADSTATVGDIAAALATAGPEGTAPAIDPASVTLRLLDPQGGRVTAVLPSGSYITETGLRSGALVDIASSSQLATVGQDAAELHVVDGPDKGLRIKLPFGATILGRATPSAVTLNDPTVSKKHMRITVGSSIEVHDLNSANGILIGEQRVQRAKVGPQDTITIGGTQIQLVQLKTPAATSGESTDIAFNRPPQVIPHVEVKKFTLPEAPTPPEPSRFPVIALMMPVILGAVMYAVTQQLYTIIFVALSPLMLVGTYFDQKSQNKKKLKAARIAFADAMEMTRKDLQAQHDADREARHSQFPPVDQIIAGALRRDGALWLRRPEHPEFLKLRLGIGSDVAAVEFNELGQAKGFPDCMEQVRELRDTFTHIHDVPIFADLRAEGGLGLCGRPEWLEQVEAAVAAQIAAEYSPAEVVITCFTSKSKLHKWEWLTWLPHVASQHSPLGPSIHLADDSGSGAELLAALEGLYEAREGTKGTSASDRGPEPVGPGGLSKATYPNPIPAVIVFIDDVSVDRARLTRIAELGPDKGIYCIWSSEDFGAIPAACRTFVAVTHGFGTLGRVRSSRVISEVTVDKVDRRQLERLARSLSPVFDAGVPVEDASDLPGAISYISLTGKELADNVETVLEHWQAAGSIIDRNPGVPAREGTKVSLSAMVGQGTEGPIHLDLRSQGPHALVGGTTGAGKSEFLQAWVLGMAQAQSPDRVTFLFVDYKGGSAFARCTDLPHFVGLVTDLSPYLVRRALTSLRAELHYREKLLNEKGAKDLVTLEERGDPDCPPSLIIVVDEFAALVSEVPEFVDGVVDVAQRGRSLGLHLILATQRPAGVIKDNLRANTNLRVALRMADEDDSQDVLGDRMAAHFPQDSPGRAAAKTGPGRITVFQSAYPGARTSEDVQVAQVEVEQLGFGRPKKWRVPARPKPLATTDQDIDRVVTTLRAAAEAAQLRLPRRPWLPELAPTYDLAKLQQRKDSELILGVIDRPELQDQVREYFYPDKEGNIAYFGASGSGKSTALRSLAIAAGITPRSGPVAVYGLDFAGGGLDMLRVLPHVGDVVTGDDEERVFRLVNYLADTVEERAGRYSSARASDITSYRRLSGLQDEERLLLLVDGLGTFAETYQTSGRLLKLWGRFQQILLDGRAVGVHVAVTADRPQAMPTSLMSSFQRKVVLRLTDSDSYTYFGLPRDVLTSTSYPGRALQVGQPNIMQLVILGENVNPLAQARAIQELAKSVFLTQRKPPMPIQALPTDLSAESTPKTVAGLPTIGVSAETLAPLPFKPTGTFALSGGPQTGRSTAMYWILNALFELFPKATYLHASARRSPLANQFAWADTAQGADQIANMLEKYRDQFEQESDDSAPQVVLFVEGIGEFSYSSCDQALQDIVSTVRANGHFLLAEADSSSWGYAGSLGGAIRGGRTGLVLCPGQGEGEGSVGVSVPGLFGKEITPGRGFLVQNGKVEKVQIPNALAQ